MLLCLAAALLSAGASRLDHATAEPTAAPPAGGDELVDRRTEHTRTWRRPDGSNETTISAAPLNYRDDAGDWQPIDTTLERAADGSLANAAGDFDVRLPEHAAAPLSVAHDGRAVAFTLIGADAGATAAADGAEAVFADALPGVDAAYAVTADSLKETLVLASAATPRSYRFALDAPGLTATVVAGGDVVLADGGGTERFRLQAPWMQDADGALSSAAAYELTTVDGRQQLTLRLDDGWLSDPARAYPVAVDPTISADADGVCTLRSGAGADVSSCSGSGPAWIGRSGGSVNRAVLALPDPEGALPATALVIDSSIDYDVVSRSSSADSELEVLALTRDVTTGATWNRATPTTRWTTPGGDVRTPRESKRTLYSALVGRTVRQVIPRYAQQLVEGRAPADGVMIRSTNESADRVDVLEDFVFSIRWHDRLGLGSQGRYEHLDLPGGMAADVDVANGNLVLGLPGPRLLGYRGRPLADRFWNSLASGYSGAYGTGEEGDFGSIAIEEQADHSSLLFGPSGVEGVFTQRPDGSFEPPPGIDAVMREGSDGSYTLFFEDTMETWTFSRSDPHRLVTAEDAYGYVVTAQYDGDGDLNSLTGSDGATLDYGFDGVHSEHATIETAGGAVHRYGYDAGDELTSYTAPAGGETRFTRDGNDRVTAIDWPDGSGLEIDYWSADGVEELRFEGPGGTPRRTLVFDGGERPQYTTVVRDGGQLYRYDFAAGPALATSLAASPTATATLALSGRVATAANGTLTVGTHALAVAAGSPSGVARVEIATDGFTERTFSYDCSSTCATSRSVSWNLNTADVPPGEHVVRVIVVGADGERREQALRVSVPYSATVITPRTRMQPTIAGRAADGETLTASISRWVGAHPIEFQPQWRRCDATGAACQDIAGETDWRYVATSADVGATLVVTVRGRNVRGVGTSSSAAFGPIAASPPVNVQLPELLGQPTILLPAYCASGDCPPEGTLTIDDGIWRGTGPITYGYQWETCTTAAASSCTPVADADGASYEVPERFDGWMRVTVTAWSPYGSATASSPVRQIGYAYVTDRGDVAFVGTARVGSLLTVDVPIPGSSYRPQWLRCNADGGDCRAIAGATGPSYLITNEDLGQRLRLRLNYYGGVSAEDSGTSAVVRGALLAPRRLAMVLDGEQLWTAKLDGSDARRIHTVSYADDLKDVAVSPDGDTIAMVTTRGIELVGANGTGRRLLLEAPSTGGSGSGPQSPSSVAFSPDGDRLVFGAYSPVDFATGIWSVEIANAAVTRLDGGWSAEVPFTDRSLPAYSPRGDRIAYLATNGSQTAIVTAAANGSAEAAVELGAYVEEGTISGKPRISEDGGEVVFSGRPLGDACGEAVFGIDLATQDVTLRSWWRNCDVGLTRPSWIGPGGTVLVASSDDTSGGGVAKRAELVDLDTGDYDVVLHAPKPITALELPQTSVPYVAAGGGDEGGTVYGNGVDPVQLSVHAFDAAIGIELLGYGPTAATPSETWDVPCGGLCPEEADHGFAVPTARLPEGATSLVAFAQNAAGTVGSTATRVIVDRTRPVPSGNAAVIASDATAQTATIVWDLASDPDLPGDLPGSGVADDQLRWHTSAAGWSSWQDATDGFLALEGVAPRATMTIETRATDAVGNVATATSTADWSPPPPDPDAGVVWEDEDGGGTLRAGGCSARFYSDAVEGGRAPYRVDLFGGGANGVRGQVRVTCPTPGVMQRVAWRVCLRAQLAGPAEEMRDIYCGVPKSIRTRTDVVDIWVRNLCASGPAFYETRVWYRRARTLDDWTIKSSPQDNIDCAYSSSWRGALKDPPYRALEGGMIAANDVPPPNRDGGTTGVGTDNGFRAQRIIPPSSLSGPQARLQNLAYRCGLARGEPDRTKFVVNEPWQAAWLRGDTLLAAGERGNRIASRAYAQLGLKGRDRAYWRDATGTAYSNAVYKRLSVAVDGRTGFCDRGRAVRAMRSIKADLEADRVPGSAPRSSDWRSAWAFRPVLRFDTGEKWRPVDVDEFALEYPTDQGEDAHHICRANGSCDGLSRVVSRPQGWTSDYVRVDMGHDDRGFGVEKYHTPHTECLPGGDTSILRDCDYGRASTMYFRMAGPFRTSSSVRYRYIDYWVFYRLNHYDISGASDHEADWEGVTIAPSPSGQTFHFAAFSQHGTYYAYLRSVLRCEDGRVRGGEGSCGSTSSSRKRVQVMVARGSHANYTTPCSEQIFTNCKQNGSGIFERGYDGEELWGNAFTDDAETLQRFPMTRGPGERNEWGSWEGNWSGNSTVEAPLQQTVNIACAHIDNPDSRCEGGPRSRSAGDDPAPAAPDEPLSPGLAALSCESWIGAGVNASTCDPDLLAEALEQQTLDGAPVAAGDALVGGDPTVAAPGLMQSAGEPLEDGDAINLGALDGGEGMLRLRIASDDEVLVATFDTATLAAARRGAPGATSDGTLSIERTSAGVEVALGGEAADEVVPASAP